VGRKRVNGVKGEHPKRKRRVGKARIGRDISEAVAERLYSLCVPSLDARGRQPYFLGGVIDGDWELEGRR